MESKKLLNVLAIILAISLSATGCKKSADIDLPAVPSLEGSSSEPVLLRYKFTTGDHFDWSMSITTI